MNKLKKINLNMKYDFSFLLSPLVLLSALSVVFYVLKLFDVSSADKIFYVIMLIILIPVTAKRIKNPYNKISFALILFTLIILYLFVYENLIVFLAEKCSKNGVVFGVINSLFKTFGLTDFENLIYHTSYGGARLINANIVTGAVDIFLIDKNCKESFMFLCGKYFLIFCAVGISFSIKKYRKEVFIITLFSVLSGNYTVYSLMLLFVFTPYYFIFLLFNFLSYFIANTAMVKGGFSVSASVYELIIFHDNIIRILAIGAFLCAVSYYFSRLAKEKLKW